MCRIISLATQSAAQLIFTRIGMNNTTSLNEYSWDGLTYKYSKSDVQVTSDKDDDRVYVDTKAENVYKDFR